MPPPNETVPVPVLLILPLPLKTPVKLKTCVLVGMLISLAEPLKDVMAFVNVSAVPVVNSVLKIALLRVTALLLPKEVAALTTTVPALIDVLPV